ncbi:hypothetical protein [Bradyrhizobium erythrophlei]|jgi:hypothetical protein|uniref:Uncharacterized protein n=1 Tax=Bradyrhizobium erythrophlei TaxID=1437360 RepID=A0A1M7US23_9BRAD|nr:hypothetical protein [Bradyrhizobium erythrophlei]SHN85687.1 hypothetical protein SAMN05444170_6400 [Bradyrhizobium erythrophlei]
MRVLSAAIVLTLLLSGPVFAQAKPPAAPQDPPKSPGQIEQEKNQDRAYKNSLGNIPDKPPADPWGQARAVDGSSSTTTTTNATKRNKSN